MLLKDFYTIIKLETSNKENCKAIIDLNKDHDIYKGHFPNNPVVPGVCLTQLIKEVIEKIENKKLQLSYADNIKFMAVVNPEINNRLQIDLKLKYNTEEKIIKVSSVTHFNEQIFFKFKGNYKAK